MAEDDNLNIRRGRFVRYAPLVLWIGVIFFLSTGQASMAETSRIVRPILEFLFPSASEETLRIYHGFIRKFAHFAEYALLAFWAARALADSSVEFLGKHRFILSAGLVFIISAIDETNQSFVSARTGSIWDVLLDFAGGLSMILFLCIFRKSKPLAATGD